MCRADHNYRLKHTHPLLCGPQTFPICRRRCCHALGFPGSRLRVSQLDGRCRRPRLGIGRLVCGAAIGTCAKPAVRLPSPAVLQAGSSATSVAPQCRVIFRDHSTNPAGLERLQGWRRCVSVQDMSSGRVSFLPSASSPAGRSFAELTWMMRASGEESADTNIGAPESFGIQAAERVGRPPRARRHFRPCSPSGRAAGG